MINPRDLAIIRFVCTYYVVTREMVRLAIMPETDRDGRACRKVLARLVEGGWIARTAMLVVNPNDGAPARVFYPTAKSLDFLSVELRDDSWLQTCTKTPNWQHLHHWIQSSRLHALFDSAAALSAEVKISGYLHEWAIANANETEPHKRFRLFKEIRKEPRLVCAPDSAFLLEFRDLKKIFYLEIDRGTTGIQAIAASKTPGYAAMEKQGLHRHHFPTTTFDTFSVLHVSMNANRRDALRRAIASKDGAHLWRFAAWPELSAETLLHGELIYDCSKGPYPLVKRPTGGGT